MAVLLTSEKVLVVFLNMENNGACQLHFGQQVEVSQNEEHFALRLKLSDHEFLVGQQVVLLILVAVNICVEFCASVEVLVFAILAVPQRENVVATLNYIQGEI